MSQVLDTPPTPAPPAAAGEDAAALAARYGLSVSGARPTLPAYVRQLWARRHFITAFATAKLTSQYSRSSLGQLWQVLTPLLNAAVYYFIFGVILKTSRGVPDYIPFLVTGVFIWTYTQSSVMSGVRAISGSMGLVRALHFPRASLPLSYCLQQLQQLLFSMVALILILLAFGVPPGPSWLLALPALALQSVFNAGLALVMARLGARTPDLNQLMPFVLRVWMYLSGVMFSLSDKLPKTDLPVVVQQAVQLNPVAVYIDLMRFALIDSFTADNLPPHIWPFAVFWALLAGVGGFIYFWKAEETYGRD
ncbi:MULTISPECIES: ABC transporter permease [unclassified Streptomyces]|uniref:ABC transporter permease n=1 Tax=unclassified Streptomyces TaxID=2593676 RepID=UPI000DB90E98|nr:ABC transporter permease [Streptomyces sp. PsTaAH-137]MYT71221.1 ABC transporter permease [Streptomyces sp. SID8367]RAJ72488.1 teichoic acid transport system permease protein [Streptomyces sp. PsTaAH-137]